MSLYERLQSFLKSDHDEACPQIRRCTIAKTREALSVMEDAHSRYSDNEIAMSYNGGKDCLVLLVLYAAYLESSWRNSPGKQRRIETVYVAINDPFREVDDFVATSAKDYNLNVVKIQKPMKEAFADYLKDHPSIRAVLVGTRRQDPHGSKLTFFDPTDQGWPSFMRVHPIINWDYAEIWELLRSLEIPYCVLYDRGYTSLGGMTNTLPNPSLHAGNNNMAVDALDNYRPAWQLANGSEERLGREQAKATPNEKVSMMNHKRSASMSSARASISR